MNPGKIEGDKLLKTCANLNSIRVHKKNSYILFPFANHSLTDCTLRKNTFTTYVEASLCGKTYKKNKQCIQGTSDSPLTGNIHQAEYLDSLWKFSIDVWKAVKVGEKIWIIPLHFSRGKKSFLCDLRLYCHVCHAFFFKNAFNK